VARFSSGSSAFKSQHSGMRSFLVAVCFSGVVDGRVFRRQESGSVAAYFEAGQSHLENQWVPVDSQQHGHFYFNPALGTSVRSLPEGALLNKAVKVERGRVAGVREDPATPAAAPAADETTPVPTIVPLGQRKSCVPHCTWNCTQPVCEQHCEPHCEVPVCDTRCPTPTNETYQGCRINCGEPDCAMFCPKTSLCPDGRKTLDCGAPKCRTQCAQPRCKFHCDDVDMKCKTVCPQPKCEWKCHKPRECPKPLCKMICEQAPDCGRRTIPVPVPDGEMVISRGMAHQLQGGWAVGNWSECSSPCGNGTQTRSVTCADPEGSCSDSRPANARACAGDGVCEWSTGPWGKCDKPCDPSGVRYRQVSCQGKECSGPRPKNSQSCAPENDPLCEICKVTIYGGGNLGKVNGKWHLTLKPGKYSSSDLEHQGVKCDDISSIRVEGHRCSTTVYEYGDFNKAHEGFKATLEEGSYTRDDMSQHGIKDNDISSLEVIKSAVLGQSVLVAVLATLFAWNGRAH